jgi:hypothetical protein
MLYEEENTLEYENFQKEILVLAIFTHPAFNV